MPKRNAIDGNHDESLPQDLEITLRVPKDAFVIRSPPPATITQRSCEAHFGVPRNHYLRLARDGAFPTKLVGKLRVATYEDVFRFLTEGAVAQRRFRETVERVEKAEIDPEPAPRSFEAVQEYVWAARSYAEWRARREEVAAEGWKLEHKYGPKL